MRLSSFGVSLFLLLTSAPPAAFPQDADDVLAGAPEVGYDAWVEYHGGEISLSFDAAPSTVALHVIREHTGIEFVLPKAAETKELSLRVARLPLESAVRSLIWSLGFENFALIYGSDGQPYRAVVLGSQVLENPTSLGDAQGNEAAAASSPFTLEEEIKRWGDLTPAERTRLEDRLKRLPPSEKRTQLVAEYGRQILGLEDSFRRGAEQ